MDFQLKPISASGIAGALAKVTHYRYLNQAEEAESICRDVIAAAPENQTAQRMLALVLSDQFEGTSSDHYAEAESVASKLTDAYERHYYTGIVHERRSKAQLLAGHQPHTLLVLFEEAMRNFGEAEKIRPKGNDDAILRWNRCARIIQGLPTHHWKGQGEAELFESGDAPPVSAKH